MYKSQGIRKPVEDERETESEEEEEEEESEDTFVASSDDEHSDDRHSQNAVQPKRTGGYMPVDHKRQIGQVNAQSSKRAKPGNVWEGQGPSKSGRDGYLFKLTNAQFPPPTTCNPGLTSAPYQNTFHSAPHRPFSFPPANNGKDAKMVQAPRIAKEQASGKVTNAPSTPLIPNTQIGTAQPSQNAAADSQFPAKKPFCPNDVSPTLLLDLISVGYLQCQINQNWPQGIKKFAQPQTGPGQPLGSNLTQPQTGPGQPQESNHTQTQTGPGQPKESNLTQPQTGPVQPQGSNLTQPRTGAGQPQGSDLRQPQTGLSQPQCPNLMQPQFGPNQPQLPNPPQFQWPKPMLFPMSDNGTQAKEVTANDSRPTSITTAEGQVSKLPEDRNASEVPNAQDAPNIQPHWFPPAQILGQIPQVSPAPYQGMPPGMHVMGSGITINIGSFNNIFQFCDPRNSVEPPKDGCTPPS